MGAGFAGDLDKLTAHFESLMSGEKQEEPQKPEQQVISVSNELDDKIVSDAIANFTKMSLEFIT